MASGDEKVNLSVVGGGAYEYGSSNGGVSISEKRAGLGVEDLSCWGRIKASMRPVKKLPLSQIPKYQNPPHEKICGLISADTIDLLISLVFALVEVFRVVMASVLVILVPSNCNTDPGITPSATSNSCSLSDIRATAFGRAAFALNIVTLAFAVGHYVVLYHREKFFIRKLDSDVETAMDRLAEIAPIYPELKNALYLIELRTFISALLISILFTVNSITSGVYILRDHYAGYQSVTVFATNIFLVLNALYRSVSQSYSGFQHHVALSLFVYNPQSFNVIDFDFVDPRDETRGGRTDQDDENGKPIVRDYHDKPMPSPEELKKIHEEWLKYGKKDDDDDEKK